MVIEFVSFIISFYDPSPGRILGFVFQHVLMSLQFTAFSGSFKLYVQFLCSRRNECACRPVDADPIEID